MDSARIVAAVKEVVERESEIRKRIREASNPFGDGRASGRIVEILRQTSENLPRPTALSV